MTILLILVFAAFTAAMALQALRAILEQRGEPASAALLRDDLRQLEELVAERALMLSALRELELDRELEKISADDYAQLKRRYERQAVQIMRRLDTLYGGRGWEASIERELTARLDAAPPAALPAAPPAEADAPAAPPSPVEADAPAGWTCPSCARVMVVDDMFCGRCGTSRPTAHAPTERAEQPVEPPQADQAPAQESAAP